MSDKKRPAGKKVDGQPRYIDKNESRSGKGTSNLYWLIPVIIVLLIVPVMIFHLGGSGEEDTASEESTSEETADSGESSEGEESGGSEESSEEGASSGDVDAEGIAMDNCASCHGQDFSGGMGPALAGTSLSEEDFTTTVREGQGSMPAFSADQVADEELTALYQFFSEQ